MPPSALPRGVRLALVGACLLVLLGVVEVASRGGVGHSSAATTSRTYTSYALTVFLIVLAAAAPFAFYFFILQQREGLLGARKSFPRRVVENIVAIAIVLAAIYVLYRARVGHDLFRHVTAAIQRSGAHRPPHLAASKAATGAQPKFEWPALWVAIALAAVAGGVAVHRRRRGARSPLALPTVADELVATIGDAIDDLEAEPDARRAVIAAYARMEGMLARHGAGRLSSETPLEYLRRVLVGLHVRREAVERLTALFEQARFSRHEIDGAMKQEAIGSLRSIRDDLEEARA